MDSAARIALCDPVIVTFLQNKVQNNKMLKYLLPKNASCRQANWWMMTLAIPFLPIRCSRHKITSIRYLYSGPTNLQNESGQISAYAILWVKWHCLLVIYLTDFHYSSSTTANNQPDMTICNANGHWVTSILLENIRSLSVNNDANASRLEKSQNNTKILLNEMK